MAKRLVGPSIDASRHLADQALTSSAGVWSHSDSVGSFGTE